MSTATLQETAFHRSRGCELHILHIWHTLQIVRIAKKNSQNGPYREGKARFEMTYFLCFQFLFVISHIYFWGVHILHIFEHI